MSNRTHLVVMPGDGIGPEITAATLNVLREVDRLLSLGLSFQEAPSGFEALKKHGTTMPDASFEAGKRADGVILGPVSHNDYPPAAQGGLNPSGEMRKRLDLYANIRPAKSRPGLPPRCGKPVDLVVVRENTARAAASSCRRRTWRSPSARSPGRVRRASPKQPSSSR
jgi:3-isopropylmalate dehydrogenase